MQLYIVVQYGTPLTHLCFQVYIFNMATDTWRPGPPLPERLYYPAYLPYENSFIVFGGFVDGSFASTNIWFFNYEEEEWDVIGQVYHSNINEI